MLPSWCVEDNMIKDEKLATRCRIPESELVGVGDLAAGITSDCCCCCGGSACDTLAPAVLCDAPRSAGVCDASAASEASGAPDAPVCCGWSPVQQVLHYYLFIWFGEFFVVLQPELLLLIVIC